RPGAPRAAGRPVVLILGMRAACGTSPRPPWCPRDAPLGSDGREPGAPPAREARHSVGRARPAHAPPGRRRRAPAATGREPATRRRGAGRGGARGPGRGALDARRAAEATLMRNTIARLAAARGWTDATLAARAGLDRAHVNQVKNGRALPTVATALAIARALGVPVATVFPAGSSASRRRASAHATSCRRS